MKKYIGYKTVGWDSKKKRAFSLYDPKITYDAKRGKSHKSSNGLFLGTTREFSIDYYSGQTDYDDLLLTCEYNETDILRGDPKSRSGEVVVKEFRIIKVEVIKNEFKIETIKLKTLLDI